MTRPVIGVISFSFLVDDSYPVHASGRMNSSAVSEVAGGMPMIIPTDPDYVSVSELMELCDGFVLTGARQNVHPEEYGEEATEAHGAFDRGRDAITLPLVRECLKVGQPLLGICRGFQEMNVALGGSLHPEIRDLPGRDNHRMPPNGTLEEKFGNTHQVTFTEGGVFHQLMGKQEVLTNTLHGQGIMEMGQDVIVDGHAPDGTPEAFYIDNVPGFAMAVQWHPEYKAGLDPVSQPLFRAFGDACREWQDGRRAPMRKSA
ncbi:MAG: gamma-glutamyl-gamma-aminobutyrate hydrolase family protein [Pseudomonadota bacterium]